METWQIVLAAAALLVALFLVVHLVAEIGALKTRLEAVAQETQDTRFQVYELRREHREAANRRIIDPIPWSQVEGQDDATQN